MLAPTVAIPDGIPTDDEIITAVKKLKSGKVPGPSGLRGDTVKTWLRAFELKEASIESEDDEAKWQSCYLNWMNCHGTGF